MVSSPRPDETIFQKFNDFSSMPLMARRTSIPSRERAANAGPGHDRRLRCCIAELRGAFAKLLRAVFLQMVNANGNLRGGRVTRPITIKLRGNTNDHNERCGARAKRHAALESGTGSLPRARHAKALSAARRVDHGRALLRAVCRRR